MTMTSAEAQAYCTTLTKQSGSNFYYSFVFLPKAKREAMYTVYAFCKAVDSAVDEPPPGSDPKEELRRWRAELELVYVGEPTWPLMISLAHHAKRLAIPKAYFEELIKGVEMDLSTTRYRTFEDLSLYCYRVASIVGLICLHIFGATSAHAQDYAVDLGMAFQLTNILRDIAQDRRSWRCYLPRTELAALGVQPQQLLDPDMVGRVRPLLDALLDLTLSHYREGWAYTLAIPRREWRLRLACAWPLLIGVSTLALVRRSQRLLDPRARVKIARTQVYGIMLRSLLSVWSDRALVRYYDHLLVRGGLVANTQ